MELKLVYEGWRYIFDPKQPYNNRLKIKTPDNKSVPEFLYKYYSLSPYNIDALQNHYLYAAHPHELNDKFDCLEHLIDLEKVPDKMKIDFFRVHGHKIEDIINNFDQLAKGFSIAFSIALNSSFGIVSMTSDVLNPLMWAHYASSNHGFAVKFNLKNFHEKILGPFPINYQETWSPIVPTDSELYLPFLYLTNIKSKVWVYENEWRFIGVGVAMSTPRFREQKEFVKNRKFSFKSDAIEEIILGNMFLDRINKDGEKGRMVLAQTPDAAYGKEKFELLNFIVDNGIKTSRISLKKGSFTFELDKQAIDIQRIDQYSFIMKDQRTE